MHRLINSIPFDIPVLLITYNRPETTCHVFEQIRKIKPTQLYIFQDGPRDEKDLELVEACQYLLDDSQINWNCKVERWSPEQNLGIAIGISSAITWAFETCDRLIILEDDCLPHPTFFSYSRHMLMKYEHNSRIMHISGTFVPDRNIGTHNDHFLSYIGHIGGWATWKRAWNKYDFWMENLPEMLSQKKIFKLLNNRDLAEYWNQQLREVYNETKKRTWDHQWQYTLFQNYGLAVVPNVNLISNIGIDGSLFVDRSMHFSETRTWKSMNTDLKLTAGKSGDIYLTRQSLSQRRLPAGLIVNWFRRLIRTT